MHDLEQMILERLSDLTVENIGQNEHISSLEERISLLENKHAKHIKMMLDLTEIISSQRDRIIDLETICEFQQAIMIQNITNLSYAEDYAMDMTIYSGSPANSLGRALLKIKTERATRDEMLTEGLRENIEDKIREKVIEKVEGYLKVD